MIHEQFSDTFKERLRQESEARSNLIGELAVHLRKTPLSGVELSRLFGLGLARTTVSEPDVGSRYALSLAAEALDRRDYREALIQTARACPELSAFSRLADRLPAAIGA